MNHGGLPTAALHGSSPPPYTFDTCDLIFLPKIWSKSMVHSPDPLKDILKRPITTIPPSITTTHHDSGLPSPLSCTLANDDTPLPLPYTRIQRSQQNLREMRRFRNNGWTKWEAVCPRRLLGHRGAWLEERFPSMNEGNEITIKWI
jgi:hypothetical protein